MRSFPLATDRRAATALSAALLAASTAWAIDFGEPAQPLDVRKWLLGQPLSIEGAKGRLVVLEFWATWDGSAHKAIPRLNRFVQFHPDDVAVVAVSDEDEPAVRKFLAEHHVAFRVALDNGANTKKAWMKTITGLPHLFIIGRDGRVAWHGDPHIGMAAALRGLLAGNYGPARYKKLNELRRQLTFTIKAGDVPATMGLLDQMIATVPEDPWAHQTKASILAKQRKMAEARDAYLAMGRSCTNDPDALAEAAQRLATSRFLHVRDMLAALEFARRAATLTASRDAGVLDTLARVHYELGHLARAIEAQALAVQLTPEPRRPPSQATLLFYRREQARRSADPDAK